MADCMKPGRANEELFVDLQRAAQETDASLQEWWPQLEAVVNSDIARALKSALAAVQKMERLLDAEIDREEGGKTR